MKMLGFDIRRIRARELETVLQFLKQNEEYCGNIQDGYNFLINNNFLVGYKKLCNDEIIVYMVRDETKNNDGIYARKKIKLFKTFLEKHKNKKILSSVRSDRKTAIKLNEYLFRYRLEPFKLKDGSSYIIFRNYRD